MIRRKAIQSVLIILCLHIGLATPPVWAQSDGYATGSNARGVSPGKSYQFGDIDNVNLKTGTVNLRIPLVSRVGRGESYSLSFVYSSKLWVIRPGQDQYGNTQWMAWDVTQELQAGRIISDDGGFLDWQQDGYTCFYGAGYTFAVTILSNFRYIRPDGAIIQFPNRKVIKELPNFALSNCQTPMAGPPPPPADERQIWVGHSDSSTMELDISGSLYVARFKDGRTEQWTTTHQRIFSKDSNGNINDANGDTLRRTALRASDGTLLNYSTVTTNQWISTQFPTTGTPQNPGCVFQFQGNLGQTTRLNLPNGQFFTFSYDPVFGELTRVDLPTGGYIRYVYQTFAGLDGGPVPPNNNCIGNLDSRRVVERRVSKDGATENVWQYNYVLDGSGAHIATEVTDPMGTRTKDKDEATEIEVRNAAGTLLRKTVNTWTADNGPVQLNQDGSTNHGERNKRLVATTTTLSDTNQVSKTETVYDQWTYSEPSFLAPYDNVVTSRMNVIETREYGYGSGAPGPLVRKTTSTYLHDSSVTYHDLHIWDRVKEKITYDAGGTQKARTILEYDTTAITSTSGVVQHDYTNYPSAAIHRGNVTETSVWRNTDGALLTSKKWYDDLGNVVQTQDPLGHNTFLSYTDSWTTATGGSTCAPSGGSARAFVTQVTNHLGHISSIKQFSCSSLTASATDPNNQTTAFTYDIFDRQDLATLPDGGQTDNDYDDVNRIVTSKVKKDASSFIANRSHFDGLGRAWRHEQCEDGPTCAQVIRTDTTFDALGRKETVTNPYRTTSDPTYGITSFVYDALGRVTKVIPPDGTASSNHVLTQYSGNLTTVTDQAGKQRRSTTDALGRLIQVDEPGGGGPATGSTGSAVVNSVNPSGGVQTYNINAVTATGWVTFGGGVQSTQSQTQSATQSSGTINVNGAEQSTQVQTQPATSGTGSINITGSVQSAYVNEPYWGCILWFEGACEEEGWIDDYHWVYDSGQVNAGVVGCSKTVEYNSGSNGSAIAMALADAINADGNCIVSASWGGSVLYLTAKATGTSTNYTFNYSSSSYYPQYFNPPSFVPSPSGTTLTGGANAQYGTVYDSGAVTVTVNQGAGQVVATANFGQSSTTSSIASDLRTTLNNSSLLVAGGSGATINLTSEAAGASTNYSLAVSWTYNTSYFGSPSFTATKSGNNMTGGSDAAYTTVYDSGTVTIAVNGINKSVSYGQGSSTATIASALATAIANDTNYPATASANGATVNLTARTAGAAANSYGLSASTTYNTSYFGSPSFTSSKSGNTLAGGVDGSVIYDSGTATMTIAGCSPFTVNYANGSTRDSVATALRSAVNASGPCPVTAGGSGSTLSLTSDATGSGVNYGLAWSATTSESTYFGSPSFSLATSGMSGGQDVQPASLATPAVTTYTYDTLDNLISVLQSGSRQRTFTYNSLAQLTQAVNPESGTINYTYDSDGNLSQKTSPKPNQTNPAVTVTATHTYDALHRLTLKSFNDGTTPSATFVYDVALTDGVSIGNPIGRLVKQEQGCAKGPISSFDAGGKIIKQWHVGAGNCAYTYTTDYAYNLAGAATSQTIPAAAATVSYGYDAAGRMTAVTSSYSSPYHPANLVTGVQYSAAGSVTQMDLGNGLRETAAFNNRLQPAEMRTFVMATGVDKLKLTFGFNAGVANNGNVITLSATAGQTLTRTYTYDELNRLKAMNGTGGTCLGLQWTYDVWGNRWYQHNTAGSCGNSSLAFDSNNRITGGGYIYDAAGNITFDPTAGSTLTYDAENRMIASSGTLGIATYLYGASGGRIQKTVGGVITAYLHDAGGNTILEHSTSGWKYAYFYAGRKVARYGNAEGRADFYHSDNLGSTRLVTKYDGTTLECDGYLPYGESDSSICTPSTTLTLTPYKFTGKERDPESGLDYFGARYYASLSGRFLSIDPLLKTLRPENPQTLNRYSYTLNNPLRYIDPTGQYEEDVHRDLTTVLAMAAGFSQAQASEIGNHTQNMDEDPKTQPVTTNEDVRKKYHFTSTHRRNDIWNVFHSSGSTYALGMFMHAYQDSYSHSQYIAAGESSHARDWTAPDKTYNDPGKADEMARGSYQILLRAADRLKASGTKVAWDKIDRHVQDFNRAKSNKDKQKALDEIRKIIEQANNPQANKPEEHKKAQ